MSVGVGRLAAAWLMEEPQFGGAGRRRENEMTEPGSRGGHSPSRGGDTSREWGAGARRSAPRRASDMQRVRSDCPGWGGRGEGRQEPSKPEQISKPAPPRGRLGVGSGGSGERGREGERVFMYARARERGKRERESEGEGERI